jgi:hypothetical protein
MHKNATKCNKTQSKWCINKHGVSKIIDTFETYQPTKSRRKQPYEVAARGGSKITRHGVIIHCAHCSEAGHNRKGCSLWKASLPPPNAEQGSAAPDAEQGSTTPNDEQGSAAPNDEHEEPVITQVCIYLE